MPDITGKRIGKLTVISRTKKDKSYRYFYLCECDCGNKAEVRRDRLISQETKSCGCLKPATHGHATHGRSKMYERWYSMLARCRNKNKKSYAYYGGKGVKVCERWHIFANFLEDMGLPPTDENGKTYHLDRIDPDGDYCPENCRWITESENKSRAQNDRWRKAT